VAAIITGQAVAIEFRLGAEAIEIVVESGEIGFGGDAVVVRIDGDQADGAIAAVGAA
jgi:hypothetical protein